MNRASTALLGLLLGTCGCAPSPVNPSFALSPSDARQALKAMANDPKPLERPLLVLGGYRDIGIGPSSFLGKLKGIVPPEQVVAVNYPLSGSFDDCRRAVIAAVEEKFPSSDERQTVEADVVGLSMGGLVARYAALERAEGKRLRINRLFTISSPHRGAAGARLPSLWQLHRDMRKDSAFLRELRAAEDERGYKIIPYVRLGDRIVGAENAAPLDAPAPYWVANPFLHSAHWGAPLDPRIVADIARRLRGERPFTTLPPAPLP